jgi:glutamate-1-semialdehyde 2,1-aminomutase
VSIRGSLSFFLHSKFLMKTIAIVQARMGSTRLPNKVMKPIGGIPMIEMLLSRLSRAKEIDEIVVATSVDERNQPLVDHVRQLGYVCEQGSENDVLDRFVKAAQKHHADVVVRITGDCPLVDPALVDEAIRCYKVANVDYCSNVVPPTYPDGLDCEVFSFYALERAAKEATEPAHREHVTLYLRESGKFTTSNVAGETDCSQERWTVDEPEDLEVVASIFAHFSPRTDFDWKEIMKLKKIKPSLFDANQQLARNEGAILGTGQKLWKRAKQIIPGGNMLLSKRAEMFLPDQWPAYFSKAKGCKVWDLDGREYIDMSIMGIGTNILGYGHPEVDEAVMQTVQSGNMSTLNCPEEVYLAEKLVEIHPWADMVRFARSGGEANAIAIRIARAASGKEKVAVCGYHGWHDWYLAANLGNDKSLDGHLLPGLEPNGVPRNLRGTVFPFTYNNFPELEALVNAQDIGVIKMEVVRNKGPEDNFLHKVRKLATDRGIVLIFDECTSGFRQTFGGLHKLYGVEPDMAMFGKALGNGYAITATIGKHAIMEAAQSTFISSTFWTERIGPTAALKTLEVMERLQSWETITATGFQIRQRWQQLADKHHLAIEHWGLPALTGYTFQSQNALAYKTLITQEMLAQGYLAGTSVYVCTEHTSNVLEGYFEALDPIFQQIKECEEGRDIMSLLKGPICHAGFKRLN